jgi:phosphatidylinositol glycan class B
MIKTIPRPILYLCLLANLVAIFFSTGFHHFDEHFQILEFANLHLGGMTNTDLPWEYGAKMRPWAMPGLAFLISKLTGSPFVTVFILRLLSVSLALFATFSLGRTVISRWFDDIPLYWIVALLGWFLPYLNVRFSAEMIGSSFFVLGLVHFLESKTARQTIMAGLLLGFSLWLRFHIGFMVAALLIFHLKQWRMVGLASLGILLAVALNIGIDSWGYGEWVFTPWSYFYQNLILGKVSGFGINPWYDYFKFIFQNAFAPFGLLIILAYLWLWTRRPKHLITAITLPFFLVHLLIGHKELRFLFPLIPLTPLVLCLFIDQVKIKPVLLKTLLAINLLLLPYGATKQAHPSERFFRQFPSIASLHYYGDENPFLIAKLKTSFYTQAPLEILALKDNEPLPDKNEVWVFSNRVKFFRALKAQAQCSVHFTDRPEWLVRLSKDKSKLWSLFRCHNP